MPSERYLLQRETSKTRYPQCVRHLLPILVLSAACTPSAPPPAPLNADAFSAETAWRHLIHQVELGPRNAGSKALEETRAWITTELEALGLDPVREDFQADTPLGTYRMANIYADFHSETAPVVTLVTAGQQHRGDAAAPTPESVNSTHRGRGHVGAHFAPVASSLSPGGLLKRQTPHGVRGSTGARQHSNPCACPCFARHQAARQFRS